MVEKIDKPASRVKPAGAKTATKASARAPAGRAAKRRIKIPYAPEEISEIFRRFEIQRPEPESELEYRNPFTLLVAVVLSAQATDAGVNKATRGLFAAADDPHAMAALGEETIRDHIKTIGLFRNKAKNVLALSQALVARHGGEVPNDRAALEALPGVGRKTANVVLNVAFGEETLAVDTHIFRIGNRLHLAPGTTPDEVEEKMLRIIPQPYRRHAHHWLILHGRYVCKARRPECEACVIADLCKAEVKTNAVPAELRPLPPGPPPALPKP
ncbi:endonuclease III [Aurantimonas sp. 22II-16-19i]|uniref:endonuclease III n=1 Tax=Aurantimonas sp. 22II-16-19i TaxID=1317114 RepID=UPI0009F7D98F|nr:endonuclease III [Aurantimonas sp. 22II-16-19i]ORE91442.1 endonuclease III [Aurantimonas sp. 22II-16-19i]